MVAGRLLSEGRSPYNLSLYAGRPLSASLSPCNLSLSFDYGRSVKIGSSHDKIVSRAFQDNGSSLDCVRFLHSSFGTKINQKFHPREKMSVPDRGNQPYRYSFLWSLQKTTLLSHLCKPPDDSVAQMINETFDMTFGVEFEMVLAFHEKLLHKHLQDTQNHSKIVKDIPKNVRRELYQACP